MTTASATALLTISIVTSLVAGALALALAIERTPNRRRGLRSVPIVSQVCPTAKGRFSPVNRAAFFHSVYGDH